MQFRTEVHIEPSAHQLSHSSPLLLLGSCFADNIGDRLIRAGFPTTVNPFGTLYNPASIAELLTRLLDRRPITEDDILPLNAEGWGSWLSHSLLSRPTRAEALCVHQQRFELAAEQLRRADTLLITFGTAWVYRLASDGQVVCNCHHEPASSFVRERLSVNDIVSLWQLLLRRLHTEHPNLHILFTVSPIRHLRDGAHEGQLSKATLLLAVEQLLAAHNNCSYFPAYEIVLDELRDYRFFADDMVHPSPLAVDYLWERFQDTFFDAQTRQLAAQQRKASKAQDHRPRLFQSESHQSTDL